MLLSGKDGLKSQNYSIILILFVFYFSFFTGCSAPEEIVIAPETDQEIIPLALGNTWVYEVEYYSADTLTSTGNSTIQIDTMITIDGVDWYSETTGSERGQYYRNTALGYEHIQLPAPRNGNENRVAAIYYKYPATAGEIWFDWNNRTSKVISSSEDVEVKAGIFKGCVHYRSFEYWREADYRLVYDDWIKPGVGIVKSRSEGNLSGDISYLERQLTEYNIE